MTIIIIMPLIAAIKFRWTGGGGGAAPASNPVIMLVFGGVDFGLLSVEFYVCIAGRRT